MKASTPGYLYLMRHAIAHTIAPELTSDEAKRSAHILLGALDELLRRETTMPAILSRAIPVGIAIARRFFTRLQAIGITPDANLLERLDAIDGRVGPHDSLAMLRQTYLTLDSILESLMIPCLGADEGSSRVRAEMRDALSEIGSWKEGIVTRQLEPLPPDASQPTSLKPLTSDKLRDFIRTCVPADPALEVVNFRALPGGLSKQTYLFEIKRGDGSVEELVARKDPTDPYLDFGCFNIEREFEFVRCLFEQGFPLPEPRWLARELADVRGKFYVMRKAPGANTGGVFSTDAITEGIMLQMAELLARLHRTPLSAFRGYLEQRKDGPILEATAGECTRRYLRDLIAARDKAVLTPDSIESFLLAWALQNVPESNGPPVPLHGDFTPHNCLWEDGRVTSVIDWECAAFGDPVVDLAYVKPHIAARMDWEKFLAHYELHLGRRIDRDAFGYYSVFLHLRTLIIVNVISTRIENREAANLVALNIDYEYAPILSKMCLDAT